MCGVDEYNVVLLYNDDDDDFFGGGGGGGEEDLKINEEIKSASAHRIHNDLSAAKSR